MIEEAARGPVLLVRAVKRLELDSIRRLQRFTNIPGIERKYFATSTAAARAYGDLAHGTFGDGPYALVATSVDGSMLPADCRAVVDRGIETVTIPTELLYALAPPIIVDEA
jgi:hypothetical protein